jgi:hypothetical protein
MVNKRHCIKKGHDKFTINLFLESFNFRYQSQYKVVAEPDPPEAIIQSGQKKRWIEVTQVFWKEELARDIYSFATEGEKHKPMAYGVFLGPDAEFAHNFVSVVKKKLEKETYLPFREKYGKGYLIVAIQYPGFTNGTFRYMEQAWCSRLINDLGCFRSIYLTYRDYDGYKIKKWKPL